MKIAIIISLFTLFAIMTTGCVFLSDSSTTGNLVVVVDQTFSTSELRQMDAVKRLLQAIQARPELHAQFYGMMPDRLYPATIEKLISTSYGFDECGQFTGGDLQKVISYFDNSSIRRVVIITDAENNFGNTPTEIPIFVNPGKFWLVGVKSDFWEDYHKAGVHAFTADQIDQLIFNLVTTGDLQQSIEGSHASDKYGGKQ